MSARTGRDGVIAEAISGGAAGIARDRAAAEAAQLGMFEVPTRFHGPRADAVRQAVARRAGPGRPEGARNKSTVAMREYLLARGVNPLIALMRYALMPPDLLAAELKCSILEAFREWRALQEALAPYLFGKAAPLDDDGKPVPLLSLHVGGLAIAPSGGAEAPWITALHEIEQNQRVIEHGAGVSHGDASHDGGK